MVHPLPADVCPQLPEEGEVATPLTLELLPSPAPLTIQPAVTPHLLSTYSPQVSMNEKAEGPLFPYPKVSAS